MDESTSSLDEREVELLFTVVRKLRDDGRAVIFVSHRLDELYALCDRVTVMRDGQTVVQSTMAEMDKLQLVTTMLDFRTPKQAREAGISTIYQEINLVPFRESERRRGREGSVAMTIAGVLLLGLVFNLLNFESGLGFISLSAYWQSVIRGVFLLLVIVLQACVLKQRGKKRVPAV
ncbi:ABC-type uncharacterized transport system ATPase subunit [Paraburkholderia sp. Cpub6]|nr:ABC-type uncharacterized transport system ATPase subunit [Paraburkholderia sp. Cpub6]